MQLNLIRAALGVDYLENICNSSAKDNNHWNFDNPHPPSDKQALQIRLHNVLCTTKSKVDTQENKLNHSNIEGEQLKLILDLKCILA